jgi:hypothetical protein
MAKSKKLDEAIAQLDSIRDDPHSDRAATILRQLLVGKQALPAANAAKLIADGGLRSLIPALLAAFPYWLEDPIQRDPGCNAKFRIAEALYRLEVPSDEVFLAGIRHVQREPVWGGQEDTACSLRNVCALGLVKSSYGDVMLELADLLADPEQSVRSGAVRAIAYSGRLEALPLLRFKLQVGDAELSVMEECFGAALAVDPDRSLCLIAKLFLAPKSLAQRLLAGERSIDGALAEMAVLAIGEAKPTGALAVLQQFWRESLALELKQSALLAIAMLRTKPAIQFLKTVLAERPLPEAIAALEALRLYEQDSIVWETVEILVEQRSETQLLQLLRASPS